jgi:ADP-heptose:LPS heptosyltransferase
VFRFGRDVLPFEEWRRFDFHKIVEEIIELDREPDQTDIWTTHFRFFGIADVPPERCRPVNIVTTKARRMAAEWLIASKIDGPVLLYQIGATSPARSQSWGRVQETAEALRDAYPDLRVVLVGGKDARAFPAMEGVSRLIGEDPLVMVGLCSLARVIVCPDSCINHIAAGLGNASPPVVSLWSSFSPESRVATYPRQFPIYNRLPCSPCFHHEFGPVEGCPLFRGDCRGLEGITPLQIVVKVAEALESKS